MSETLVRDPIEEQVDVVVVGGGFSGLIFPQCVRQTGGRSVEVYDAGQPSKYGTRNG